MYNFRWKMTPYIHPPSPSCTVADEDALHSWTFGAKIIPLYAVMHTLLFPLLLMININIFIVTIVMKFKSPAQ